MMFYKYMEFPNLPELPKLTPQQMDRVSDYIRDAEAKMLAAGYFFDVRPNHNPLSWKKQDGCNSYRIYVTWAKFQPDRPLMECPIEARVRLLKYVPELMLSAAQAVREIEALIPQ